MYLRSLYRLIPEQLSLAVEAPAEWCASIAPTHPLSARQTKGVETYRDRHGIADWVSLWCIAPFIGVSVPVGEIYDERKGLVREHHLTRESIQRGIAWLEFHNPRHLGDMLREADDIETHDAILQACTLGGIRYG